MKKLQTLLVVGVIGGAGLIVGPAAADERSDAFLLGVAKAAEQTLVLAVDVRRVPPQLSPAESVVVHPDDIYVLPPVVETPVVTVPADQIPVPEQIGWTWDRATLTVTNHEVEPSIQVLAYYGGFQRPLMPVAILSPGQSVTIPGAPCGERMVVAVDGSVVEPDFTVC